jgi:dTDP-4-amino-4,6-dideoxygalactose transaminase
MLNTFFSSWPSFDNDEVNAVKNVLLSNKVNYWTGDECRKFENEFSIWTHSKYSIALSNGTVALDLALRALDIGIDDEVIVTSRTFIASVSSIVNAGANPVFVDVDKNSQNICPSLIPPAITKNTKAIMCVHLAGFPCEMDEIISIAKENNLRIIEDCSQAHGALYKGKSVGSIGDIGTWSFCQDKIMTTGGEGGMVTTNSKVLWSKMWSYKDHGKSWEAMSKNNPSNKFQWVHDSFGTNWRMTEMQAAIGRIQLRKMQHWHIARKNNAEKIIEICKKYPLLYRLPVIDKIFDHAWYKCYIFINEKNMKDDWTRDRIVEEINLLSVPCFVGSCSEVYLEKAFDKTKFRPKFRLKNAKELGETSLMFLVHPSLTIDEIDRACTAIKKVSIMATKVASS